MYRVENLFKQHGKELGLKLVSGAEGMERPVKVAEAHRPGLSLAGYLKHHAGKRILVFGKVEVEYLRTLDSEVRSARLEALLSSRQVPALVVTRNYRPPKELLDLADSYRTPLFRSTMQTMALLSKLTLLLNADFAPSKTLHGTLVEVFGVGVLIQGDSSVGKSETALGLIERGHRLISDDVVKVKRKEGGVLEGTGVELTRHHIEIRGIGIINVAHIYGMVRVRDKKVINLVVKLEVWDDQHFYDRIGAEDKLTEILGISIPCHVLPVKPGRDVVLLLETIALNHRLKGMGYNSAQEFKAKVLDMTTGRRKV